MSQSLPVTIRRLAKISGYSKTTVSSALRGDRRVAESTRLLIVQCAQREKYQQNPLTSRLFSAIARRVHLKATPLMVLSFWGEPRIWDVRPDDVGRCYQGICQRASQLGHRVEAICVTANGIDEFTLKSILKTRATEGIILLAPPNLYKLPDFDLTPYVCSVWGDRRDLFFPSADLNGEACVHTLLKELHKHGYTRLGIVKTGGGFDTATVIKDIVHQYGIQQSFWVGTTEYASEFGDWIKNFKPQVLIVPDCDTARDIVKAGYIVPTDFALVVFSRAREEDKFAGMDLCYEAHGACLVDLVLDQLFVEKPGAVAASETRLLGGYWREGPSLPDRRDRPKAEPAHSTSSGADQKFGDHAVD